MQSTVLPDPDSNVNKCHELTFELAVMLLVKQYYVKAIKLNMNQNQQ